jgi:hypothetical protein
MMTYMATPMKYIGDCDDEHRNGDADAPGNDAVWLLIALGGPAR